MPAQRDFSVAIVGGGIVGLICAIGIARAGVQVDVFETASRYGDIGAGIGVGPTAVKCLELMGILDEVVARSQGQGPSMRLFRFTRGADPHAVIYEYPPGPYTENETMGLGLHRAAFLEALSRVLPPLVKSHFNKRCVGIESSAAAADCVLLRFSDDSTHEADVVFGADGIKSTVRMKVFGAMGDRLVDTGTRAYRGLIPAQRLRDAGIKDEMLRPWPRGWLGKDQHIISYPIQDGSIHNVVAFSTDFANAMVPPGPQSSWTTWVTPVTREETLEEFKNFGRDARTMLQCIEAPSKWAVHGLYPPLETYVAAVGEGQRLNVALIGDAAHAMLPHLGSGAGTGIEDAYVLSSLLGHPQTRRRNLSDVLRAYDQVRVPRGSFIASASKRAGDVYEGHGPSGPSDEGRRKDLDLQWEPIWRHDVRADVADAVGMLVKSGAFRREERALL
ncbi:unnamed protein product [Peniophora sp. CBMAI 1063]|nr:unnamed protein product [Peniophora sp. CBMAI 1063]